MIIMILMLLITVLNQVSQKLNSIGLYNQGRINHKADKAKSLGPTRKNGAYKG